MVASYLFAPLVFLFLHANTVIQYERLAAKVRTFERSIATLAGADAMRQRALITGFTFAQALAAEPGAARPSSLFRLMTWLTIAGIPILVLLAVQISFVRYQSESITLVHQICIVLDLALLGWFYWRLVGQVAGAPEGVWGIIARFRQHLRGYALALFVFAVSIGYATVPTGEETWIGTDSTRTAREEHAERSFFGWLSLPQQIVLGRRHLLDHVLCPLTAWGCRYLNLNNRTLVAWAPAEVLARASRRDVTLTTA